MSQGLSFLYSISNHYITTSDKYGILLIYVRCTQVFLYDKRSITTTYIKGVEPYIMADDVKQVAAKTIVAKNGKSARYSMRMYDEDYHLLNYWSDAFGVDKSEFLVDAMRHYIKWKNQDYDLPTAERQRLNQLIDTIDNLAIRQRHVESAVTTGFDSVLGIMHGANYLVEDEDGQL